MAEKKHTPPALRASIPAKFAIFGLRLGYSRPAKCKRVCFCPRLSVSLTSSKTLPFGNVQINLTLLSLIRIFVADSTFPYDEILRIPPRPAPRSAALRGRLPPVDALRHGRGFRTRNDLPHQSPDDPAGRRNLHRSHGARRRDETFDVDLRRDVAAEPHQPRRERLARQPPDLQHSGRRLREPSERRHVRHHRQTARRSVGFRRKRGTENTEHRFDPAAGGLPQNPHRREPARQGRSAHPARLQLDRQGLHGRPDRPHARTKRLGELPGDDRRQRPLPGCERAGRKMAHRHRNPLRQQFLGPGSATYRGGDRHQLHHFGQLPPLLLYPRRPQDRTHDRPRHRPERRLAAALAPWRRPANWNAKG